NHLTKVERTVVALYYNDELTMREIGEVLSISESRVCQIHTKLLKKLKAHLIAIVNGNEKPVRVPPLPRRDDMPAPSNAQTARVATSAVPPTPEPPTSAAFA